MVYKTMNTKVCIARSFEEARSIELLNDKTTLKSIILRSFITLWVLGANSLLWVFKRIFFKSKNFSANEIKKIAVYTVGTLGDNVLMLPAIAAVKRRFSNARVTAITNCDGFSEHPAREILGTSPYVDKLITLSVHPMQRKGWRLVINFPDIEEFSCDLFVNLSPFGNRGWIGAVGREMLFARRLGARWAVGFKMSTYTRKGIFNAVQHRFMKNEARRPRQVLQEIGLAPIEDEDLLAEDATAKERVKIILSKYLNSSRPLIVLNPGAKLKASQWPAERFGMIATWLVKTYNASVLVNGTEAEMELCDEVVRASGGLAINLAGKLTIKELIELLRISNACVTNNTGTMTLSAMVGIPTVVLSSTRFSPTFYMPISEKLVNVFSFSECSYSYNDEGGTSEDLKQIEVSDVIQAMKEVFSPGSNMVNG